MEFHPVGFLRLLRANPAGWQQGSRFGLAHGETVPLTGDPDLSNVATRWAEALAGPLAGCMGEGVIALTDSSEM